MKCYDVRRKLSAVLDGAAEGDLRDAVARHLGGCPACRAELEALASVDDAVARAVRAGDEAPAGYFDDLWRRLEPQLGPDPEMDEIKKLAAEIVEESARQAVTAPVATSPGQVVLPAARPARRAPWIAAAAGGAAVAAAVLLLVWVGRGPKYERVQPPPSTGPEPPPAEVVTKIKPKEEPAVPAAPPRPPARLERKPASANDETPAPAPVATPGAKPEEILAPPRSPEPAAAPVLPKLGHEEIDRAMKKIAPKVAACFDLHGIVGKVMVRVKIQPDGSVAAADLEGQPSDGGECVTGAVREASFPPFEGPPMTIRYPFQGE